MQLWTPEHVRTLLPALAFMILFSALLGRLLRNKSDKIRMLPLQVIAVILILIEIGKQVISLIRGYDLYHLPFHYCSIFIFMLPLAAFYRGKKQTELRGVTAALCAAVFLLMMIYPNLIYSAFDITNFFGEYLCFHTVFFHNLVLLAFFLMISLKVHKAEHTRAEIRSVCIFMAVFSVVAAAMSQLLKTNYANMYSCNVPPLENIRLSTQGILGYALTQVLYDLAVTALQILFTLLSYGLYRLVCSLIARTAKVRNRTADKQSE